MTRLRPLSTLPPSALEAWQALAAKSHTPNVFADPRWVIASAALDEVDPSIAWQGTDGAPELILPLGPAPATRAMPIPHTRAYWTENSYQASALCETLPRVEQIQALAAALRQTRAGRGAALTLIAQPEGGQAEAFDTALGPPLVSKSWSRAAITLSGPVADPLEHVSKNKRKKARRAESRLQERGEVSFRVLRGDETTSGRTSAAETFLELEHQGWKSHQGTSLRSLGRREVWFRALVSAFGNDAVFTQLCCDDTPVASSINLVSGRTAFGLKVGWHQDYADSSPGVLHELSFVRNASGIFDGVDLVDSVSDAQSFIDPWWPDRRPFRTATYVCSRLTRAAGAVGRIAARGAQ